MQSQSQEQERTGHQQVELERGAKHQQMRWTRGIEALKRGAAKQAVINDGWLQDNTQFGGRVDPSGPSAAASAVEVLGVFSREQSLGLTIAILLVEVGAQR